MASKSQYVLEVLIGASKSPTFSSSISSASKSLDTIGKTAKRAAKIATAAFAAVNVSRVVEDAVETYSTFEKSMANTAGIASASASEYKMMEDAAREAGRGTTKTATEAAEALGYMSLAGWDANTSVKALMPVLKLSEATGAELQTTSDLVTDSMSALGLEVSQLPSYLDKLVMSNNKANNSSEQVMEAMIKSGGAARTLGADLDDTITAIGILANNGKKGAEGGTALNSILTRLASNTQAKKAMDALGISIWDANGNFVGLQESLIRIQKAMSGLTNEEQANYMKQIAGTHYYSQLKYLLDGVAESADGSASAWDNLKSSVDNSEGSLDKMNATVTNTLVGSWERFKSALDDAKISLVGVFSEDAQGVLDRAAEKIPKVTDALTNFLEAHKGGISNAIENTENVMSNLFDTLMAGGGWLIDHQGAVVGALSAIGSAMVFNKGVKTTQKTTEFITNFVKNANPISLAAIGIAAGAGAIAGIATKIHNIQTKMKNENLAEHFGKITLSAEELDDAAKQIIQSKSLTKVQQIMSQIDELDGVGDNIKTAATELDKLDWKVKAGMTLDTTDQDDYKAAIDQFVTEAQNYASTKQYVVDVSMDILSDGSIESQNISEKVNAFYSSQQATLAKLGKKLNKAVTEAFNDGLLDIDEADKIAKIRKKMADIQTQLAQSEFSSELDLAGEKYAGGDLTAGSFKNLTDELGEKTKEAEKSYDDAYKNAMDGLRMSYQNGAISEQEFESEKERYSLERKKRIGDTRQQALDFATGTIMQQYGTTLTPAIDSMDSQLSGIMNQLYSPESIQSIQSGATVDWDKMLNEFSNSLANTGMSESARMAIADLWESLKPQVEDQQELAQQYVNAGQEIPQSIIQGLNSASQIGALAGDTGSMWSVLANAVTNDGNYKQISSTLSKQGSELPEAVATAVAQNQQAADQSIDNLYDRMDYYLQNKMSKGFMVDTKVNINLTPNVNGNNIPTAPKANTPKASGTNNQTPGSTYIQHAEGGIFSTPHWGVFAESGPEAFIPLDNSDHAKAVWQQAGMMLGMDSTGRDGRLAAMSYDQEDQGGAGYTVQVNYNPNITISGSASKDDVTDAVSMGAEYVRDIIKDYFAEKKRTSFA